MCRLLKSMITFCFHKCFSNYLDVFLLKNPDQIFCLFLENFYHTLFRKPLQRYKRTLILCVKKDTEKPTTTVKHLLQGVTTKAVNREDKRSRRYRDRDFAKFERSRRYRDR
jgi:hypothetical protein